MTERDSATAITFANGWFEGPKYNLIMMLIGAAALLAAIVVPLYVARRRRLRRERKPRISLPVDNACNGENVTLTASGLNRFEMVTQFFTNHPVAVNVPLAKRLGAIPLQADSNGRLSELITVPADLPPGENLIVVQRPGPNADPAEVATRFYVRAQRNGHQGG
jgi:hypothetical protein